MKKDLHSTSTFNFTRAQTLVLPDTGLLNFQQLRPFIPFSRSTAYRKMAAGLFPRGVLLGNTICWRVEDVRAWIESTLPAGLWKPAAV